MAHQKSDSRHRAPERSAVREKGGKPSLTPPLGAWCDGWDFVFINSVPGLGLRPSCYVQTMHAIFLRKKKNSDFITNSDQVVIIGEKKEWGRWGPGLGKKIFTICLLDVWFKP